jgi:putative effector of murein hydrolase
MREFFSQSAFFCVALSVGAYLAGLVIAKKTGLAIFNPFLVTMAIIIPVLLLLKIDYVAYSEGTKFLNYLLTPTTVCLAVPLYQKLEILKRNWKAICIGVVSGILANFAGVFVISLLFGLTHTQYVTMLPRSITAAIGMPLSEELGGVVSITVTMIMGAGIIGNALAVPILKMFRITDPVAKGVAIGCSSHILGTAKAMEIGETEGAMSSLALIVSGLTTVACVSLVANLI